MNYYDYRSYFQYIEKQLDNIYSRQEDILTELQQTHNDLQTDLEKINDTLTAGITLISALLVLTAAIKVLFK